MLCIIRVFNMCFISGARNDVSRGISEDKSHAVGFDFHLANGAMM